MTNRYAVDNAILVANSHVLIKLWHGIRPQMANRYAVVSTKLAVNSHVSIKLWYGAYL